MFTKTFRHTPGPELMGNAVVLFAIGLSTHWIGGLLLEGAMRYAQFGFSVDINAIIYRALIIIPAYILYFAAALMGLLGVVAGGVERAAVIRHVKTE